jgi:tetratricopeptide (TPR) repeat protein
MIARLITWMFYAVVFFLLGVWVGGFSSGLRGLLRDGVGQVQVAGEDIYRWAYQSIGKSAPAPEPAQAPTLSPFPPQSAVASPPPPTAPSATLESARAAFARGEVSQSIALYHDLLKAKPDDVDARGELGNVLLGAGRLKEAATTFYETAVRLARAGDVQRAKALALSVRRGDPELADKLNAELNALGASGKQSANIFPIRRAA